MLLIDFEEGRIVDDDEIKRKLAAEHPYAAWLEATQFKLHELPDLAEEHREEFSRATVPARPNDPTTHLNQQQAFGYTQEDIQFFLEPMARDADDPVGSMGTDTPIAALSSKPKLLYNYFKQNFAQVTNPPIDPIREELVMSLVSMIGPRPNLLGHEAGSHYRLEVAQPILTDGDLKKIHAIETLVSAFRTDTLDATWPAVGGRRRHGAGARSALPRGDRGGARRPQHPDPVRPRDFRRAGADPGVARDLGGAPSPDPPRPAHLDRHRRRDRRGARGSSFLRIGRLWRGGDQPLSRLCHDRADPRRKRRCRSGPSEVQKNYIKAVGKGILKVISKMGISTYQSYCGAQIFDAVGLASDFVEKYFTGTATTIEGVGLREIAEEAVARHRHAYGDHLIYHDMLDAGGDYAFRLRGEDHAWTPQSVAKLQHAVRGNSLDDYRAFAATINDQSERLLTIRGLMSLNFADAAAAARRGRAGERDRQAVRDRRDELRLDQPRGAYDTWPSR